MDIPDRSLIATYYYDGRIDDDAVYFRDGKLVFAGHGFDADCVWDTVERKWMLIWGSLEKGERGPSEPDREPLDPYEPCGCSSCTDVE